MTPVAFSASMSSGFRAVAKTRQPRACMPCAAHWPMPLEQPVIRIERGIAPLRTEAPAPLPPAGPLWQNAARPKAQSRKNDPEIRPGANARSQDLSETLIIVVSIFGLIGLGYLAARIGLLSTAVGERLTEFVFTLAIPLPPLRDAGDGRFPRRVAVADLGGLFRPLRDRLGRSRI